MTFELVDEWERSQRHEAPSLQTVVRAMQTVEQAVGLIVSGVGLNGPC